MNRKIKKNSRTTQDTTVQFIVEFILKSAQDCHIIIGQVLLGVVLKS